MGGGEPNLELTIIGSGTSVPCSGRGSPGYIVEVAGKVLAFDIGPGTVHRWVDVGISYLDLTEIYISHMHPDHIADILTLLFALRNPHFRRERPLRIFGPEGLVDYYRGLLGLYGNWVEEEGYDLELKEIAGGEVWRDSYRVIAGRVEHTAASLGYRIEDLDGRVVVYSGDTGSCDGIVELGRGARVMLLECSVPEEKRLEGHLTPTLAGMIAAECNVEKLVLTHFYPVFEGIDITDRVRQVYDGEVILAKDSMRIKV